MVKRTEKAATVIMDADLRDPALDDSDDLDSDEQDIVAAIGELDGAEDSRWQITRVPPVPQGKTAGFCGTMASTEVSKENIMQTYGRGKYRVRGLRGNGQFLKQYTLEIANDPPSATVAAVAPASPAPTDLLGILQMQDERRAKARMELLTVCAPILAAVLPGFLNRPAPQQTTMKDILESLVAMQSLQPKQPDMTDALFKAMEFGRDAAEGKPGKDGDDSWLGLAKGAANQLLPLLANRSPNPAPRVPVSAQVTATPSTVPQIENPPHQGDDVNLQLIGLIPWAKRTLKLLVEKARKNADASLYAEYVLDNPPDNTDISPFVQYLMQENWFYYLQQFDADVTPYEGWFTEFRVELIKLIEEQKALIAGDDDDGAPLQDDDGHDRG